MELIQVYGTSPTSAVAAAITGVVLEYHQAEVEAVGAKAVEQAVEALALASSYLKCDGIFITCVPELSRVTVENKVKTVIKFVVKPDHSAGFAFLGVSANPHRTELPRV